MLWLTRHMVTLHLLLIITADLFWRNHTRRELVNAIAPRPIILYAAGVHRHVRLAAAAVVAMHHFRETPQRYYVIMITWLCNYICNIRAIPLSLHL